MPFNKVTTRTLEEKLVSQYISVQRVKITNRFAYQLIVRGALEFYE